MQKRLKHRKSRLIVSDLVFIHFSRKKVRANSLSLLIDANGIINVHQGNYFSCRKKWNCWSFHQVHLHLAWVFMGLAGQLQVIRFGFWFSYYKFSNNLLSKFIFFSCSHIEQMKGGIRQSSSSLLPSLASQPCFWHFSA